MGLAVIAAVARNGVIGQNNQLPWRLPEDLSRFKALTMGHHIIMGRKTYESLGRLLPGRTTVIVSRNPHYAVDGAIVVNSLEKALAACEGDDQPYMIGGAELYRQALPLAQRLYLTRIEQDYEGDAWFPEYEVTEWKEIARQACTSSTGLEYSFVDYIRS